ncbi:MAG TPA: RidA family protein [Rudaea sp.]|nr:RidA family protein [Rudaea sp.]
MNIRTLALIPLVLLALPAIAKDVIRYKIPNSDFPIAQAVEVPAGQSVIFLSGAGPQLLDKAAPGKTPAAYGDTKTQTISTLNAIATNLKGMGLEMKDVVKMQAFLVGDPAHEGEMDFAGFMEGYKQFFGTKEQPNLPARSTVKVAGLANPGWLVEIEVTAVRK